MVHHQSVPYRVSLFPGNRVPLRWLPILLVFLLASAGGWGARAGLVGFYSFDDPANPLADTSGRGRHLKVAAGSNPVWSATNGFGGSGTYDFSNDRLIAPIDVNPAAMPRMTWGAWVRTDTIASGLRKVLGHDNGAWDRTIGLDNRNPGLVRYTSFTGDDPVNGSGPVEGTPRPLNTTNWTFLAAAYDQPSKKVTVFVDLDASTTNDPLVAVTESAGFGVGFNTFAIGDIRPDATSEPWNGMIDSVFVFDEALEVAALTALRNQGRIVIAPRIISFTASPSVIRSGGVITLSWNTSEAETLSIDGGAASIDGRTGSIAVSPTTSRTYTLTAANSAGQVTASVTIGVDVEVRPPQLTEFMALNGGSLVDGNGDSSDWIELHNPNPFAISLAGYTLRDSATTWVIPDVQLGGGEFLVVFASGLTLTNSIDAGGFLHATFQLAAGGEVLQLLDVDGRTVLFQFSGVPIQHRDVSWGMDPKTGTVGYFAPPTPGRVNGPALAGIVAEPRLDVDRGFYESAFNVTLTCATPDAFISYTTDGSEPASDHGTVVGAPALGGTPLTAVAITRTTPLRAIAFKPGWIPSAVATRTYLFLGQVIDQPAKPPGLPATWGVYVGLDGKTAGSPVPADYEMKPAIVNSDRPGMLAALRALPTLSIVADPADLFGREGILSNPFADIDGSGVTTQRPFIPDRRCSIEWIQPDRARELQTNCAVRLVGGWSRHYEASPKKSLQLSFLRTFGAGKLKFPVFGEGEIDEFDTLNLRATFSDGWVDNAHPAQYLRDPFVRETYLAMGGPGSRGNFVHLYLNGLYWGIYNPSERPDENYASSHYGGADADYDALKHEGLQGPGQAVTDSFEVIGGSSARWERALQISGGNLADPAEYAKFKEYVDVISLADYILVNTFLSNLDWPGKNWYAFGRRDGADGGFKFSPWDSEYSLEDLDANRLDITGTLNPARFYERARLNAEFKLLFADRIHKHAFNDGPLTAAAMLARYSTMAARLEPAITAEAARWGDNPNTRQGVRDYRKADWLFARDRILNSYLPNRPAVVLSQYRAAGLYPSVEAPEFNQPGGLIDPPLIRFGNSVTGTVYYTLDGSDPRLPGGGISPRSTALVVSNSTALLLPFEADGWRYRVTPTGLGDSEIVEGKSGYDRSNWKHPDFDDSVWPVGQAMLGYGTINNKVIRTTIEFGGDPLKRYPTSYFRKEFVVTDPSSIGELLIDLIRDDGAIVYLNGREAARSNLKVGNQRYSDFANAESSPEERAVRFRYLPPPGSLRSGTNMIAVELHQRSASNNDLGIDLALKGVLASQPITLGRSSTVKARLLLSAGRWSALSESVFRVTAEPASARNLVISKLHYHPAAPTPSEIADGFSSQRDFEFIELMNYGDRSINLAGVSLSEGIGFRFASDSTVELLPGERGVLVGNLAAFRRRYGVGAKVVGEFASGSLNNDGETITLLAPDRSILWRFTYSPQAPWPESPAGLGPALTLIDPNHPPDNSGLSLPQHWRPSADVGGKPGSEDRRFLAAWLAGRLNTDPLADPDGDGINQLQAFATGALDTTPAAHFLAFISLEEFALGGVVGLHPVLHRRELIGASGIIHGLESSVDLREWESAGSELLSVFDHGDGSMTRRFRIIERAPDRFRFFRLSVSQQR